jgi:aprataxin
LVFSIIVPLNRCGILVYDRYPKAYAHLLILPKKAEHACDTLQQLTPGHVKILQKMAVVASKIAERLTQDDPLLLNFNKQYGHVFMAGFHAVPSLTPIHMHLISRDLNSPSMKTATHYLSFTTPFFLQLSDVFTELKTNKFFGDKKHLEDHINGELICHLDQTNFKRKMAKLRAHLARIWAINDAQARGVPYEDITASSEGIDNDAEVPRAESVEIEAQDSQEIR